MKPVLCPTKSYTYTSPFPVSNELSVRSRLTEGAFQKASSLVFAHDLIKSEIDFFSIRTKSEHWIAAVKENFQNTAVEEGLQCATHLSAISGMVCFSVFADRQGFVQGRTPWLLYCLGIRECG